MTRPFEGTRVLDLTHVLAGPFCTYQLAVLGADVIKIESPRAPDCVRGRGPDDTLNRAGMGITYQTQGANKRALALDLATAGGAAAMRRLVGTADVLVENYRSGALAALGFGAEAVAALNPRLIYCSLTGFGQDGPRGAVNAYDNVIQAASGVMARTGTAETGPVKTAASFVDYTAGLNAAFAIAAALLQRTVTGVGQRIDCAMFDAALLTLGPELAASLSRSGPAPERTEAGIGCYDTADGLLMLGAFHPGQNRRLWEALARPDFAALETWDDLWANGEAMRTELRERLRARSADDWITLFRGIGIPAERVRGLDEAARDPQLDHRALLHTLPPGPDGPAVTVPVAAFRYAHGGPSVDSPPPRLGADSGAILGEIGYAESEIAALRRSGAVA